MTSKQVMLTTIVLLLTGCGLFKPTPSRPLISPYPTQRVWALAPLRNDSGSSQADGLKMADHLHRHLDNTSGLQVLPLNRTLAAMESLGIEQVSTPAHCRQLLRVLGVDGLVIGSITSYDPYDPPTLGLAIELWINTTVRQEDHRSVRDLTRAATAVEADLERNQATEPDNTVADTFDASDPHVRDMLKRYAVDRGTESSDDWRRYRISIDLYSEFVTYVMSWRLLDYEAQRIAPPEENTSPNEHAARDTRS